MITTKDWKEYTKQIDARDKLRSERDIREMQKHYEEEKIQREIHYRNHVERERVKKQFARDHGEYYFESFYYYPMMYRSFGIYYNDRTMEACMDWIVKGRPKITL